MIVAHRGASCCAVDNTLASFRLAKEHGTDMIELDIRRTLDGQPVVVHDPTITLLDGCERRVERLTLDVLLGTPLEGGERIPAWESVVALCVELDMGIYVELKDADAAVTARVVRTLKDASLLDRCVFLGARPDHVFYVKQVEPAARTAFSYRNADIDPVLIARACNSDGLNLAWEDYPDPCALITPEWLARVRAAGLRVMSWHEEREPVMRRLVELGIDDLCTNDPRMTRRLVDERR